MSSNGLLEKLKNGETIICAGSCFTELERRGLIKMDSYSHEVVMNYPDRLRELYEEFVHCGCDVIAAWHQPVAIILPEGIIRDEERCIRKSLQIARSVADKTRTLVAAPVFTSRIEPTGAQTSSTRLRDELQARIKIAVEEKADFLLGSMFSSFGEAKLALEYMKEHGNGLPIVMTLSIDAKETTNDGVPVPDALGALKELGADVVGISCSRGPTTMMPLLREVKKRFKGPLAVLPAAYRMSEEEVVIEALTDPLTGAALYPLDLDRALCSREDIKRFALETKSLGIPFVGLCCGALPSFFREIAEIYERETPASKFRVNLKHTNIYLKNPPPHRAKT